MPIDLTTSQKTTLTALTNLYLGTQEAIKGRHIAEEVGRTPASIRNKMQSLKALQLVEGVPGPEGGYKPTPRAYEVLDISQLDEPVSVPLRVNGDPIEGVLVEAINLKQVHHPAVCRAEIHIQGSIRELVEGTLLEVGPTALSELVITGEIEGKFPANNTLLLTIESIQAPAASAK